MAYAFFDVDGTLISLKSMLSFQDYWYATYDGSPRKRVAFETEMADLRRRGATREELNRRYYTHFAGRPVDAVSRAAVRWFDHILRSTDDLFHPKVVSRLLSHHAQGIEPVFVSGSFPAILGPIAERLGVRHILATTMAEKNGIYTGAIHAQTIGAGKVEAMKAFLDGRGVAANDCHAYGDDISDLPMLRAVGGPAAVRGDRRLESHARRAGWEVLSPV